MNVTIQDSAVLRQLSHLDVRAYLFSQGWAECGSYGPHASIHTHADQDGREWEILLPNRSDIADYAARMADALGALAAVERRSALDVLADLQQSGVDVVRVRVPGADTGTIHIQDGVQLHEQAANMLLAAACAVVQPRPLYRAGKVSEAVEYLQTVRLGQTERGSFVITLQSPVAPALKRQRAAEDGPEYADDDAPFARKVTAKLAQAWQALQAAVTEVATADDFSAFERRVAHGVNANLCESVALLARHGQGIDLGLAWARVRPSNLPNVRQFFTADAGRILEEAAREFRRNQPRLDIPLEGFVVNLDRAPEEFNGSATLRLTIDGRPKRVKATFDPAAYDLVIRAFQEKTMLALDGDLYPLGQRLELRNPRNVALVEDVDATGS